MAFPGWQAKWEEAVQRRLFVVVCYLSDHVRCAGTELHILGLLVVDAGLLRIVTVGARAPTSASSHLLTGCVQSVRMHLHKARVWRKRCARQGACWFEGIKASAHNALSYGMDSTE